MTALETPEVITEESGAQIEAFAMRLLGSVVALMDLSTIRMGKELGLYDALVGAPPLTAPELAQRSGTDERYVREWLEQQVVTAILTVHHDASAPDDRRYTLPAAHAEVLVNRASPAYLGALGSTTELSAVMPELIASFRDGRGVPWAHYGDAVRTMQAELNRPGYLTALAQEWMPAMPEVEHRLRSASVSRIADVGCGAGWSSIAFARAYPDVEVDGFDADDASIAEARRNAAEAGVEDRVRFEVRDAADPGLPVGSYDLVVAFECIHDLPQPVEALAAMRRMVAPHGYVVVADNAVADAPAGPGGEIERLLHGSSVLVCLPTGRAHPHSAATGAVMRPSTFRQYARKAGFTSVEVAEVPHPFWTFYRLTV